MHQLHILRELVWVLQGPLDDVPVALLALMCLQLQLPEQVLADQLQQQRHTHTLWHTHIVTHTHTHTHIHTHMLWHKNTGTGQDSDPCNA
jgi:hypothetical protein